MEPKSVFPVSFQRVSAELFCHRMQDAWCVPRWSDRVVSCVPPGLPGGCVLPAALGGSPPRVRRAGDARHPPRQDHREDLDPGPLLPKREVGRIPRRDGAEPGHQDLPQWHRQIQLQVRECGLSEQCSCGVRTSVQKSAHASSLLTTSHVPPWQTIPCCWAPLGTDWACAGALDYVRLRRCEAVASSAFRDVFCSRSCAESRRQVLRVLKQSTRRCTQRKSPKSSVASEKCCKHKPRTQMRGGGPRAKIVSSCLLT